MGVTSSRRLIRSTGEAVGPVGAAVLEWVIREFPQRFVFKSFARASVYLARRVWCNF